MPAEPRRLEDRVQAIEDRLAVEDVIVQYARAVDGHDDEQLAACFTDDAEASFAGVSAGTGGAAIAAFISSTMGGADRPVTTHRFTNVVVALDGDAADVESSAIVYAVRDGEQLKLRGVAYRDRFVRTPSGWRIRRRVHSVAWEGAADNVPLTPVLPRDSTERSG